MRIISVALLLVVAGCAGSGPATPAPLPDRITVSHILISFSGAFRSNASRSQAQAEKLVNDLKDQVSRGKDFGFLMKRYSDDPGDGTYTMVNHGVTATGEAEFRRDQMVPAFGDVGFTLKVGEIGLAPHDPEKSPFGYHLIRRVK